MKTRTNLHAGAACYTVQPGDSLSSIASRYGASWDVIYQANRTAIGLNPNVIRAGQKLYIP
ncbi:MAG: LysM peptidoglycan-binding domain-containing protein [Chloroflexota bacterium]